MPTPPKRNAPPSTRTAPKAPPVAARTSTPKRPAHGRGFFGGIGRATSTATRAPFISRPGVCLVRVKRISAGGNRSNQPYFHMDVKVLHNLQDGTVSDEVHKLNTTTVGQGKPPLFLPGGHEAGEDLAWRVKVHGEYIETQLGNIKNAVEALLDALGADHPGSDGDMDDDELDEEWERIIFDEETGFASPDQPGAGLLLIASTDLRLNKTGSAVYSVTTWAEGESVAADLVEKGELDRKIIGLPAEDE